MVMSMVTENTANTIPHITKAMVNTVIIAVTVVMKVLMLVSMMKILEPKW
jgi:hypothetical protein